MKIDASSIKQDFGELIPIYLQSYFLVKQNCYSSDPSSFCFDLIPLFLQMNKCVCKCVAHINNQNIERAG